MEHIKVRSIKAIVEGLCRVKNLSSVDVLNGSQFPKVMNMNDSEWVNGNAFVNWLQWLDSSMVSLADWTEVLKQIEKKLKENTTDELDSLDASAALRSALSLATLLNFPQSAAQKEPRVKVLLIDDDIVLLETMAEIIEALHDPIAVTDATVALARIQAGETFDAILCDLMMPNMDGTEFYESLQKISPEHCSRIVFLTGGSFTEKSDTFLCQAEIKHIQKPVLSQELFSTISQIISRTTSAKIGISS